MNRRHFHSIAAAAAMAAAGGPAWAQASPYQAGKHYTVIDPRVPTENPGGIEVVDFFWYGCPHCNVARPIMEAWKKDLPADVQVRRVPVAFRSDFAIHQKLFYALEAFKRLDDLHAKAFAALHVEKKRLRTPEEVGEFAAANGIDRDEMLKMLDSFGVATRVRQATQVAQAYRIDGVPSIGIDGRFLTSAAMAGGHDQALRVTEFLIGQARTSRKG